ncbi:MAG TPA: DNA repair protein RecO [Hyphomicrobiales bacterium]|nr:DNA repair protein RecO [Kaistiaceae bacterium]HQF29908.1 DNA repair protein RecO [Hyphomicrobiales bacterium]
MQWTDEGIILGARRHGEGSVILEVMTAAHGRHMGLVRGGRSRRMQAALQPGNAVDIVWRARLDEHLGNFTVEPTDLRAARLMESPVATYGVLLLGAHLRLLPERDPHPALYGALRIVLDELHEPLHAGALMVRFEMALLDELGFGLDLSECAATGLTEDLVWVSPRSGRAVSRAAGAPYADKLLALPAFLAGPGAPKGAGAENRRGERAVEEGAAESKDVIPAQAGIHAAPRGSSAPETASPDLSAIGPDLSSVIPDLSSAMPGSSPVIPAQAGIQPLDEGQGTGARIDAAAIRDGFRLTEFFLTRHVLEPRGTTLADARAGFLKALDRALGA